MALKSLFLHTLMDRKSHSSDPRDSDNGTLIFPRCSSWTESGQTAWSVSESRNVAVWSITVGGQIVGQCEITYLPKDDHIDMAMEVLNTSNDQWRSGGEAMSCLSPSGSKEWPRGLD